jgi:two-component system, LuxR family, sensor kinase FixL
MSAEPPASEALQAVLDAAVDGVILIDHAGAVQGFNRSAETLFGYESSEVLGRNVSIFMTKGDGTGHDGYLAQYLATRVSHIIGTGREITAQRKDGSVFRALLSVGAIAGVEPPRFVGFVHDLTSQQQAEQDGMHLQRRLMRASRLATFGEMGSGMAHELNQPLAAIATFAHACNRLLDLPDPDIAEIQDALRQIADQAVRAGDIIRRLRDLTQTASSEFAPADVNGIIVELADLIQSDAKAHGVLYRAELTPGLPRVTLHRAQLQEAILNLVRNALESVALAQLDVREVVVRSGLTPDGAVEITVCDNGPGVDSRIAGRMFDPFWTTKSTGTGLGLAISRTIAQTHRGSLEYSPRSPSGACFAINLPAESPGVYP